MSKCGGPGKSGGETSENGFDVKVELWKVLLVLRSGSSDEVHVNAEVVKNYCII